MGFATCGTFQTQPRGRVGRGGEEERAKGEFLNPSKKKNKKKSDMQPSQAYNESQCPENCRIAKEEVTAERGGWRNGVAPGIGRRRKFKMESDGIHMEKRKKRKEVKKIKIKKIPKRRERW